MRDIERKVLAILRNYTNGNRRNPTFKEISTKTGKHENEIRFILNKLQEMGYIEWDRKNMSNIKVLKAWDDKPLPMKDSSNSQIGKM